MRVIKNRNVNHNYPLVMRTVKFLGVSETTRNGRAQVMTEPVSTVTLQPCERVLFDPARRANPFFHLFESMWMLAGRDDAAFLDQFVHDFGARYADENGALWGAYGHRWRREFDMDQIVVAIEMLRTSPGTRRCVIQMWDVGIDLDNRVSKDLPCNTHIYLRRRPPAHDALDMTVLCRSNDAVWGLCGANVVHFSVLQEYLAHLLNVRVGVLTQVSNDLHVYDDTAHFWSEIPAPDDLYSQGKVEASPLFSGVEDDDEFVDQLTAWVQNPTDEARGEWPSIFRNLLVPMARAHAERNSPSAARFRAEQVRYTDWCWAARQWLVDRDSRRRKREEKAS